MTSCIAVESYGHPGSHPPSIITQDELNRFVTDDQITNWDNMADHQFIITGNPHQVTAEEVGLGNCNNTSDAQKPVSDATQTALDEKTDAADYLAHFHTQLRNQTDTITGVEVDSAGNIRLQHGVAINEFSDDTTMAGQSSYAIPTEKAVVSYVASAIANASYSFLAAPDGSPAIAFSVTPAGRVACYHGVAIDRFSDDATMVGNSDAAVPTERAVKGFVANELQNFFPSKLATADGSDINAFVIDSVGRARFPTGVSISRFSSDGSLASESNEYLPTEKAVKDYVDNAVSHAHPAGITQTLQFAGAASGEVAALIITKGVITDVTLVP